MLSRSPNSSISAGSTTSSAYAMVDITSRPLACIAAMYCLPRITNRAIATLPLSSIARSNSTYGFGVAPGAT